MQMTSPLPQKQRGTIGPLDEGEKGHEFEQALGDSEGYGSLACCSLWSRKELDTS